jgi:N-6 DNA Methylase
MLTNVEPYVKSLEALTADMSWFSEHPESHQRAEKALNGELSKTLRRVVPIKTLQTYGAFFTPDPMADRLLSTLRKYVDTDTPILDPACGGGNLLLAQAKHLPIQSNLTSTIRNWGMLLHGSDLHSAFVRATKARLILLAAQRGKFYGEKLDFLPDLLPNIVVRDGLLAPLPNLSMALNPPFTRVPSPRSCQWATGKVSQAALFVTRCLEQIGPGLHIAAILPDVLRSGTNYRAWRAWISERSDILKMEQLGRFDAETNVDVFMLVLRSRDTTQKKRKIQDFWIKLPKNLQETATIATHCKVNVGRVVPFRDAEIGNEYPYLEIKDAPAWGRTKELPIRRFDGVTYKPPFVAVRRNSRSDDANRAVATLVTGKRKIAVENHLIVISPLEGTVAACQQIMRVLSNPKTNNWLNTVINCRHLTVKAISSIPWWET